MQSLILAKKRWRRRDQKFKVIFKLQVRASLGYVEPVSKHKQVKTAAVAIHRALKEHGKVPSSTKVGDGEFLNP